MLTTSLTLQDIKTGRVSRVRDALSELAGAHEFRRLRVAVDEDNPGLWILALALRRWIADYDCEIAVHGCLFLSFELLCVRFPSIQEGGNQRRILPDDEQNSCGRRRTAERTPLSAPALAS
jgi:hypothetical protein